jgi:hypothetical protein
VIIEYSNAPASRHNSPLGGLAFAVSGLVFLIVPIALMVIGYYSGRPTGTLLSPLPQSILSEDTPTPTRPITENLPLIASDNTSTDSAVTTVSNSNSSDGTATLKAGATEVKIESNKINSNSQILIIPKSQDSSVYFVKSKDTDFFILGSDKASNQDRLIDYQIVNP